MSLIDAYDTASYNTLLNNWRLTPATFMHKVSRGGWIPAPWLMYVSTRIASAIARGNGRVIISAPPRHGKSELISVGTSAWVLENFSNRNVILAAYGADLAEGFGRRVRDLIRDNGDLLKVRLKNDKGAVNSFLTDNGGYMFSVGLGGSITGRGAHVLLIDDFIKEIKEALSPAHREYLWNWFVTTARTRLEPGATIIIIATRWHSDDLIGRLIKAFPGRWENIVFPAICEGAEGFVDAIGRKPGEALFPERYSVSDLREMQEELGSTFFQALYQQHPVDEAKKISDGAWLKIVDLCPNLNTPFIRLCRVWDLAATEGGGDWTTGTLGAYDRSNGYFYILNVIRRQLSPKQVEEIVRATAVADGQEVEIGIEQEPGSSGKALVEHYQRTVLKEFKVLPVPVSGAASKLIRAQPLLAAAEASKVLLVRGDWNEAFIREFDLFPAGPYDDQVDTASACYTRLSGKKLYSASWGRKPKDDVANRKSSKAIRGAALQLGNRRSASWGRRY